MQKEKNSLLAQEHLFRDLGISNISERGVYFLPASVHEKLNPLESNFLFFQQYFHKNWCKTLQDVNYHVPEKHWFQFLW